MKKYIYYITADFAASEEFWNAPIEKNIELLEQWFQDGKVEKYTIEDFVQAFNDEYISDLGMLYYV